MEEETTVWLQVIGPRTFSMDGVTMRRGDPPVEFPISVLAYQGVQFAFAEGWLISVDPPVTEPDPEDGEKTTARKKK